MPRLTSAELLLQLERDLLRAGSGLRLVSGEKPFVFKGQPSGDLPALLRVHIWNITHGGASRNVGEFRIQITPPMRAPGTGEMNVVLGWSDDVGVYAGWDPALHSSRSSYSPSLQVDLDTLQSAADRGIASQARGSGDLVVAFDPAYLDFYLTNSARLHGASSEVLLELVTSIAAGAEVNLPREEADDRALIVSTVVRRFREASFRDRVLSAYGHACAVCGTQLGLVEAAHILPVASDGSSDETSSGVALCRNHHRAYDSALLSFDSQYRVVVSNSKAADLERESQGAGIADLRALHGRAMCGLPQLHSSRPGIENLMRGDRARSFAL